MDVSHFKTLYTRRLRTNKIDPNSVDSFGAEKVRRVDELNTDGVYRLRA